MKKLLVFGSINLDVSLRVPRLPHEGETLMGSGVHISPGGKGANQAHAARRFGADVILVGAVGTDAFAEPALRLLGSSGVDLSSVRRLDDTATGTATIAVGTTGENAIVVAPEANGALRADWAAAELIEGCDTLLLQMEVPVTESMEVARRFKQAGGRVMLNLAPISNLPSIDPTALDWLIVNQSELEELADFLRAPWGSANERASFVATLWKCNVVVTLGGEGAAACEYNGRTIMVAPLAVDVVDTTGAGDTFCGVFAAALMTGNPLEEALHLASVAAGLACQRSGAQASQPDWVEIENSLPKARLNSRESGISER